jgi:L-glyceraldehyde 3-phosphate reductase
MPYVASLTRYQGMKYNRCGNSGLKLPAISLGTWQHFGEADTYAVNRAIVCRAFDLGVTHIDLANNYGAPPGSSEEIIGKILRTDLCDHRDELIITTKAGYGMWEGPYGDWSSKKYLVSSLDQSLKRLGLDYVDIFYSHRYDPETPLEETMAALDQIVRRGKALYVGLSNYDVTHTKEALKILKELGTPCLIHQPSYSMYNRWIEEGLLDLLEREGVGSVVFQPLQRGALTDAFLDGIPVKSAASLREIGITEERVAKSQKLNVLARERGQTLAQMALAWALRGGRVTSVLAGAKCVAHIEDNVKALNNLDFCQEELDRIEAILAHSQPA